ncbi:MAG: hypothetical protein V7629_20035 [Motiliproteus sp.]
MEFITAIILGAIHGSFRIAQQGQGFRTILRGDAQANTDGAEQLLGVDLKRLIKGINNFLGYVLGIMQLMQHLQYDQEFIPAKPGRGVT